MSALAGVARFPSQEIPAEVVDHVRRRLDRGEDVEIIGLCDVNHRGAPRPW
ncbi:hypothetical protein GCM10027294_52840 [Marinactinospora endophytica]